jgi:hypothetical protein
LLLREEMTIKMSAYVVCMKDRSDRSSHMHTCVSTTIYHRHARTSILSLPVVPLMSALTASPFSGLRTAMIMSAPHPARIRALSFPTPAEAPVTMIVLPVRSVGRAAQGVKEDGWMD